jgi:hypothetical protein
MASMRLKKAVALGRVVVINPNCGEVKVFLYNSVTRKQFSVDVQPGELEIAPRFCTPQDMLLSRNLESLLNTGLLRLKG